MAECKIIDIEEGRPVVAQALAILEQEIRNGKKRGYGALKVIHGYGSSGVGGRLRTGIRKYLAGQREQGIIREVIPGEDFSIFHMTALEMIGRCPQLSKDRDLERRNQGITFVVF